jgi:hypothetical protein
MGRSRSARSSLLVLVATTISGGAAQAAGNGCERPAASGYWQGTMNRRATSIPVVFDLSCDGGRLRASFTSMSQRDSRH